MAAARSRGETQAKPRPDAYVGLLGLSFLALFVAILFAYLNWSQISEKPKSVQMAPLGGGARSTPAPPPGPGVVPGQGAPGGAAPPAPGTPPQPKQ